MSSSVARICLHTYALREISICWLTRSHLHIDTMTARCPRLAFGGGLHLFRLLMAILPLAHDPSPPPLRIRD